MGWRPHPFARRPPSPRSGYRNHHGLTHAAVPSLTPHPPQTGLPLDVSAAWALPPPALAALPPRSASVPCTEDGGSKGAALGGLSLEEELARTRTMLALAQERNQLLEGLLEEHRLQGREQLEKIKALTRVNKDCRKEIATLQSQVWSQITTSLTRTPAPNAHAHGCGPVRYGGPAPPPPPLQHVAPQHQHQQQQQLYGAPYHRYARSGSGSPTEGEERDRRCVHVM